MINTTYNIPALLADSPSANVSSQYNFISTKEVVDTIGEHGWHPREAFFVKSMVEENDPLHAKHCIRFSNPDIREAPSGGNPEIVMYNAHNGTSSLQLLSGVFRMVCSNGMIIRGEEFGDVVIQHRGAMANMDYISGMVRILAKRADNIVSRVDEFSSVDLTSDTKRAFYKDAIKLRFADAQPGEEWIFDLAQRQEDAGQDLWTVMNRTQEYLENGGFMVTHNADKPARMSRELSNIERLKNLNTDIWEYTENFYETVAA